MLTSLMVEEQLGVYGAGCMALSFKSLTVEWWVDHAKIVIAKYLLGAYFHLILEQKEMNEAMSIKRSQVSHRTSDLGIWVDSSTIC